MGIYLLSRFSSVYRSGLRAETPRFFLGIGRVVGEKTVHQSTGSVTMECSRLCVGVIGSKQSGTFIKQLFLMVYGGRSNARERLKSWAHMRQVIRCRGPTRTLSFVSRCPRQAAWYCDKLCRRRKKRTDVELQQEGARSITTIKIMLTVERHCFRAVCTLASTRLPTLNGP